MKRKIVVYAGYAYEPYNIENVSSTPGCSGSENALMKLCEALAEDEDNEVVVCFEPIIEGTYRGVKHMSKKNLIMYQSENEVDVLIISRYVHYIFEMPLAKKNYVWVHDRHFHSGWNGSRMNEKVIGQNIHTLFDAIVCVSEWQRNFMIDRYKVKPENQDKFVCIPNGIDLDSFRPIDMSQKQKGKMIFNCRTDGLQEAIDIFKGYKSKVPEAELHVFGQGDRLKQVNGDLEGVIDRGFVSNQTMIDEMATAEYWMNPSPWLETFCIAALEAQLSRTFPIITPDGGMIESTNCYFSAHDRNLTESLVQYGVTYGDPQSMLDSNYDHAVSYTWKRCTDSFKKMIYKL